jgi:hypothetical protein
LIVLGLEAPGRACAPLTTNDPAKATMAANSKRRIFCFSVSLQIEALGDSRKSSKGAAP